MIFTIETPKPPDDIWPVLIDFSARLDTEDGEKITGVSLTPYRLESWDKVLDTLDTTDAYLLSLTIKRYGQPSIVRSYVLQGQKSVRLLLPAEYGNLDFDVVDLRPEQVLIVPEEGNPQGEPPATGVVFKLQRGRPGTRYALEVTVVTNKGNQHSCLLRWLVDKLL